MVPVMSWAVGVEVPFKFPATIVFLNVNVPLTTLRPPPAPPPRSSLSVVLPVTVTLVSVVVPVAPLL